MFALSVVQLTADALPSKWSFATHEQPTNLDGAFYPSRLNGENNLAIYGRAVAKLQVVPERDLKHAVGLPDALDDFLVALV